MNDERSGFKEFYPALCNLDHRVETIEQYMSAIDYAYRVLWDDTGIKDEIKYSPKLWFRGVKASDYPLLPSIGRNNLTVENETVYMSKFKSKAVPYLSDPALSPGSDFISAYWKWLFLMHQYGIPTRIMDWTEDALVALIFAIDADATQEEKSKDAAVWCLNPIKLNTAFSFHDYYPAGYIPNVQEKSVYRLFGPFKNRFINKKPVAVYSSVTSPKIIVQRGTFTVFPYTVPLEDMKELPDSCQYLFKIVLSKNAREIMTEQLRRYGITKAQLMPELESVAQEIFREEF
jgi:hypothetical protein